MLSRLSLPLFTLIAAVCLAVPQAWALTSEESHEQIDRARHNLNEAEHHLRDARENVERAQRRLDQAIDGRREGPRRMEHARENVRVAELAVADAEVRFSAAAADTNRWAARVGSIRQALADAQAQADDARAEVDQLRSADDSGRQLQQQIAATEADLAAAQERIDAAIDAALTQLEARADYQQAMDDYGDIQVRWVLLQFQRPLDAEALAWNDMDLAAADEVLSTMEDQALAADAAVQAADARAARINAALGDLQARLKEAPAPADPSEAMDRLAAEQQNVQAISADLTDAQGQWSAAAACAQQCQAEFDSRRLSLAATQREWIDRRHDMDGRGDDLGRLQADLRQAQASHQRAQRLRDEAATALRDREREAAEFYARHARDEGKGSDKPAPKPADPPKRVAPKPADPPKHVDPPKPANPPKHVDPKPADPPKHVDPPKPPDPPKRAEQPKRVDPPPAPPPPPPARRDPPPPPPAKDAGAKHDDPPARKSDGGAAKKDSDSAPKSDAGNPSKKTGDTTPPDSAPPRRGSRK